MEEKRSCREVNGRIICEDEGLFGGNSRSPAQVTRPVRPTRTTPRPVSVPEQTAPPISTKTASEPIVVNIPPKALIEQTQYGEVQKATCKRSRKTGKLECKILTS